MPGVQRFDPVEGKYFEFDSKEDDEQEGDPGITVWTTTEGVALRWSPLTYDHTLIKRLPKNSAVVTLDSDAGSRIGVTGKWLKVRDSSGTEGYIAAWYVAV